MKKFLALSASLLVLSAPSFAEADANTVLVEVNGKSITVGHIVALASRLPQQYDTVDPAQLFDGILDQLVQQELIGASADINEKAFQTMLDNESRTIRAEIALDAIVENAVTEDSVNAAYQVRIEGIEPVPQYRASHILVETEETANEVLALAQAEGADFAALAQEHSTGPSGPSGGDLNWFGQGAMVPEFDQAVQAMAVDEVTGPVQTQFGFHIIKLFDKRDYVPSLDELRAEIEDNLRRSAVDAETGRLEAAAEIERFDTDFDISRIRDQSLLDEM